LKNFNVIACRTDIFLLPALPQPRRQMSPICGDLSSGELCNISDELNAP
jgi:hypothetical protein